MLTATAASLIVGLHVHTAHFKDPDGYRFNDNTPGAYLRVTNPDYSLLGGQPTVGVFRNSIRRTSFYGGLTWETSDARWSFTAALATGYQIKRETGQQWCDPGRMHFPPFVICSGDVGSSHARLRPMVAGSVAFPEARKFIGVTPRLSLLGKAVHLSLEF